MNKDYLSEFSPRCMSYGGAFLSLSKSVTTYIILPLAAIALISGIGAELSASVGSGSLDFGEMLDQFNVYLRNLMIYSIPLIILSIFVGLYDKGSYARIPFRLVYCLYLAVMLLMFTKGGHMDMVIDGSAFGGQLDSLTLVLNIEAVIYILAIISALKGFLAFAEFSDNRKKYLENSAKNFNKKDKKKAKWLVFENDDSEKPKKKKKKSKKEEYYEEDE